MKNGLITCGFLKRCALSLGGGLHFARLFKFAHCVLGALKQHELIDALLHVDDAAESCCP